MGPKPSVSDRMERNVADLYIVRHGQSADNVFPKQGPLGLVDPDLTLAGLEQAEAVATCFENENIPQPDFVFCSVLARAQETALLAFPNSSVYVAPYISEEGWDHHFLSPASYPNPRQQQAASVKRSIGQERFSRLSYELAPPHQMQCGPPDWGHFTDWLWNQQDIKDWVIAGKRPTIAVVSHGNFLGHLIPQHNFTTKHPRNGEVYSGVIKMRTDETGFGEMIVNGIVCAGIAGDSLAKSIWLSGALAVSALVLVLVCRFARAPGCARTKREPLLEVREK